MSEELRGLVGSYLDRLAAGAISPGEAADWALRVMEEESADTVDPGIWSALDRLAGADLLEGPGKYLHGHADFADWRDEFEADVSR